MTSGDGGTTHGWRSSTATRSSTRAPARTRPTSSAASTSCCCRSQASGTSAVPLDLLRRFWRDTLAQPDPGDLAARARRALSVPFVDYARGDGRAVGPGGDVEWSPTIVSDEDGWIDRYRGLWGLDTGDRFAGERAPAGPKYTRTGSVRQSWHDPLGFAGLGKTAPPSQAIPVLEARIAELAADKATVTAEARALEVSLPALDAELGAVRGTAGLDSYRAERALELQDRRGAPDQPAGPGGGARHRDRGRARTGDRAARRAISTIPGSICTTRPSPNRPPSRVSEPSARPGPP